MTVERFPGHSPSVSEVLELGRFQVQKVGPIRNELFSFPPLSLLPAAAMSFSRRELRLVTLPLLLLGIPTHLLFIKQPIRIRTCGGWIHQLLHLQSFPLSIFTVVLFLIAVGLNGFIFYNVAVVVDLLVVKGQFSLVIVENLLQVIQCIPLLIPLNYLWVKGHDLQDLVQSLIEPDPSSSSFVRNPDLVSQLANRGESRKTVEPCVTKLVGAYLVAVCIHLAHAWILLGILHEHGLVDMGSLHRHVLNYVLGPVFCTSMLVVYMAIAWALSRQFRVLNMYLRNLDVEYGLKMADLSAFKVTFRDLANRVQEVNALFEFYISFVLFWTLLSTLTVEVFDLQAVGEIPVHSGLEEVNELTGDVNNLKAIDSRSVVRVILLVVTSVCLKVALIMYTVWTAVEMNDGARAVNLWMNHIASAPNADMTLDKYHAFRLLKSYVHSRFQQPLPALLRISIAWELLPFLQYRLNPIPPGQYD